MKRLFIAIHYLEIGGAERSLIGLLNALDYSKYDVDLFVYEHRGEFMKLIPKEVHLLPEIKSYAAIEKPMVQALKKGQVGVVAGRLWARWKSKKFSKKEGYKNNIASFQYIASSVSPFLPSLYKYGEYDLAISFLIPHNIVRDKVNAKRKWAWVHTDYSFLEIDKRAEYPVWSSYDKIVCVSDEVAKGFLTKFPTLNDRILVMENILSPKFIREQSEIGTGLEFRDKSLGFRAYGLDFRDRCIEPYNKEDTLNSQPLTLNFLSVGRYTLAKNFDNVPFICKLLVDKGLRFKWYIIGFGGDEALIRSNIEKAGMQDVCILLGKRENPYPYMKACDFYIQPSRFEGKAVTVREAQILCKSVIITNYATSASQVKNGVDGVIVPQGNEQTAEGIYTFVQDKALQEQIVTYLQSHDYGNEDEVRKLER